MTVARIVPWVVFCIGLVLATAPAWKFVVFGFDPTVDQLLTIVCDPRP